MDTSPGKNTKSLGESESTDGQSSKKSITPSFKDKLRTKKQRFDALIKKQAPVRLIAEKDSMMKLLLQAMVIGSKATITYISSEKAINEIFDLMFCTELSQNCAKLAHAAWSILTIESKDMLEVMTDLKKPHMERFLSFLDQEQTLCTGKPPSDSDLVPIWAVPNVFYYFSTTFRRWLLAKPEKMYDFLLQNQKKLLERLSRHLHSVEIIFVLVSILKTEKKLPKDHPANQWCLDTVVPFILNHFTSHPDRATTIVKEVLLGLSINRDWQFDIFHVFVETLITKHFHHVFTALNNPKTTCDGMEVYYACLSYTTTTIGKGPQLLVPLTKQVIQNIKSLQKMMESPNNLVAQNGLLIVNQQLQRGGLDIVQATLPGIIKAFFKYPKRNIFAHSVAIMIIFIFKNERYHFFQTQLVQDIKLPKLIAEAQTAGKISKYADWGLYVTKMVQSIPEAEKSSLPPLVELEKSYKSRAEIPKDSVFNISNELRKQQAQASQAKLASDGKDDEKTDSKEEKSKDKDKDKEKDKEKEKSKKK